MTVNYAEVIKTDSANAFNVRDEYKNYTIEELRSVACSEARTIEVCILNVTGEWNIGTIVRTSSLMGIRRCHIIGRRHLDCRTMVGAMNYIPIEKHDGFLANEMGFDVNVFKNVFDQYNLTPIFAETTGKPLHRMNFKEHDFQGRVPCFVFGNEGRGIPENILEEGSNIPGACVVKIPMKSVLRSFNVSTAASILMYKFNVDMGYYDE